MLFNQTFCDESGTVEIAIGRGQVQVELATLLIKSFQQLPKGFFFFIDFG
jgi:hypothetical protein